MALTREPSIRQAHVAFRVFANHELVSFSCTVCSAVSPGPAIGGLGSLELRDLFGDRLVEPGLELGTVSKEEEDLKPDKERGEEQSLDEIVKQSGSTAFEDTVSNELSKPSKDVQAKSIVVGRHTVG